ncbi:hypothetical protein CEXT_383391 [Caerostris extrusa]|uniref:Uncharacterized protein n=1 Tax=Caerostris extrusa TaxID=172846 RepID=A0AAV4PD74_CAEEX|nr:hypothetical protein CEXT_383391 [Caerostris extrusa]
MVTPAVLPGALPTATGVVATRIQIPASVAAPAISPTVITYPTYVANTNSIIARPTNPVLGRSAPPAVSILSVVPTLPTAAAYSVARPRPAYQIQPVVYTNVPPPQAPNLAQPPPVVMSLAEPREIILCHLNSLILLQ